MSETTLQVYMGLNLPSHLSAFLREQRLQGSFLKADTLENVVDIHTPRNMETGQ